MARLRQQAFPLDDYPSGTFQVGPFNVRNQDIGFEFAIDRCTTATPALWPNTATTIALTTEQSLDNGQTWQGAGGLTAGGGIGVGENGEMTSTIFRTEIRGSGNQRRLRATIVIAGGPLRSQGFLDLLDS